MKLVERNSCVVCSSEKMNDIQTIENCPIYMGISKKSSSDIFETQNWSICCECGCVQLSKLIPMDILYKVPHNPAIGNTWNTHFKKFSQFISADCGKNLMEVGGGNCNLFREIDTVFNFDSYVVCDLRCDSEDSRIDHKKEFYSSNIDGVFDAIIHSHTMEHFYNPKDYTSLFNKNLKIGGKVYISVPDIKELLRHGHNNAINFEHTYMVNEEYVDHIMMSRGFEKSKTEHFSKFNLFLSYTKVSDGYNDPPLKNQYNENKKIVEDYVKEQTEFVDYANDQFINEKNKFIFGCHVTTQLLIQFGLNTDDVIGILDNDEHKKGKVLYGTSLETFCPSVLGDLDSACVIVKMGIYTKEIVEGLQKWNTNLKIIC